MPNELRIQKNQNEVGMVNTETEMSEYGIKTKKHSVLTDTICFGFKVIKLDKNPI